MKRTLVLILCSIALTLSACNHENIPITKNDLPQSAQQFLNRYFSTCTIYQVLRDGHEYEVKFTNGFEVDFDKNGDWKEVDCHISAVPSAIVPMTIANYVSTNFPQNYIVKISVDHHGYDVELNNDMDLEFDKNGKFLRRDD